MCAALKTSAKAKPKRLRSLNTARSAQPNIVAFNAPIRNFRAPLVASVSAGKKHGFGKEIQSTITLLAGLGVEGDAHCGACVQHLYDQAKDPTRPNLRQVHLIEQELLDQLGTLFALNPGHLGENITTVGIDLPRLDEGTVLQIGTKALIRVSGLREPCVKIARFQRGLLKAITAKRDGRPFMRGGVMGVVVASGEVSGGDGIQIRSSAGHRSRILRPV